MSLSLLKKKRSPETGESTVPKSGIKDRLKHLGWKRIIALVLICALGFWAWDDSSAENPVLVRPPL